MQNNQLIDTIASKIDHLPPLPGIAIKLLEAVRQKDPNIDEISKIISSDVVLTTKILKLANSPFYGFKSKITTIERAISMLGLNTIKSLALSFSVTTTFYDDERDMSQLLEKTKTELAHLSMELIASLHEKGREVDFFREQAALDGLTGISNYKGFCTALEREMSPNISRDGFIQLADDALYQAKRTGRNRCCASE